MENLPRNGSEILRGFERRSKDAWRDGKAQSSVWAETATEMISAETISGNRYCLRPLGPWRVRSIDL